MYGAYLGSETTYFNPRAPYGARPRTIRQTIARNSISIHAPHTGRDVKLERLQTRSEIFQSTRPIRGATPDQCLYRIKHTNFNPRAPYGARPGAGIEPAAQDAISIHAPHTGRDLGPRSRKGLKLHFNPRAPYGARLCFALVIRLIKGISIHAPHTGRDRKRWLHRWPVVVFQSTRPIRGATLRIFVVAKHIVHFNPRAPYGARHKPKTLFSVLKIFQSTRPIRGATAKMHNLCSAFLQ